MKTEGAKAPFFVFEQTSPRAMNPLATTTPSGESGEKTRPELLADLKASIQALLDGYFVGQDWFVVESRWSGDARKLTVNLDGDQGVTIEVCTGLNRAIGALLDEHPWDSPVLLEVGSPGADTPFSMPRQYPQHIGRRLQVTTLLGEIHEGTLLEADENGFGLETKAGPERFSYEQVRQSRVLLPF